MHFSAIEVDGYRELHQGQRVEFEAEPADQDGYAYQAVRVQVEPTHNEPASTKSASTKPASTEPVNGEQRSATPGR
ncbi:cold shock domain-containing protein [Dactylosporangium sp. NPDC050688]|uniref:cold-shock protein n=1 Tax=Dactylosporangium sp. NPDC050688 TaxID=3157217 RepID=UPI00341003B1